MASPLTAWRLGLSPRIAHVRPAEQQRRSRRAALGRWGQPPELAPAALLLASDAGSYITEAILVVMVVSRREQSANMQPMNRPSAGFAARHLSGLIGTAHRAFQAKQANTLAVWDRHYAFGIHQKTVGRSSCGLACSAMLERHSLEPVNNSTSAQPMPSHFELHGVLGSTRSSLRRAFAAAG
jgi:hypothetical protein